MAKKRRLFYLITIVSTLLFATLQFWDPAVMKDHIESKTYDLRLHLRQKIVGQPPPPADIVIVAVDEKSIKEIGGWPWGRDVLARLVDMISEGHPKAIGIDIIFSEKKPADDQLVRALEKAGNAVLAMPFVIPVGTRKAGPPAGQTPHSWK
jgi:adenylate cyclase